VIADYGCVAMFTAPTAFRAIKKEDPNGKLLKQYDLSRFRALFLAGERADPDTLAWAENLLNVPVIDHWWQTETAGRSSAIRSAWMLPVKHGSPTVPMPGYDVRVVDEACHEVPANRMGSIVVKLPLPPSCLPTLCSRTSASAKATSRNSPATTRPPTPATSTMTATST